MTVTENAADWTRFWSRPHDDAGAAYARESRSIGSSVSSSSSSSSFLSRFGWSATTHTRRRSLSVEDSWPSYMPEGYAHGSRSKAVLLSRILSNASCREELRHFLSKEVSSESLDFLESVEKLRSLSDEEKALSAAGVIYRTFIAHGGTKEITMSSSLRKTTTSAYEEFRPDKHERKTPFDDVQREVERLLELDSLDRFLASPGGRYSRLVLEASPEGGGTLLFARVAKHKPGHRWVQRICELTVHSLCFYHPCANDPDKKNLSTRREYPLECVLEISDASVDISAAPRHHEAMPPPENVHILQIKVLSNRSKKVVKIALSSAKEKHQWLDKLNRCVSVAKDLLQSHHSVDSSASGGGGVIFRSAHSIIAAFSRNHHLSIPQYHHHHDKMPPPPLTTVSPPSPMPRSPPPPSRSTNAAASADEVKEDQESDSPTLVPECRSDPGERRSLSAYDSTAATTPNRMAVSSTTVTRRQSRSEDEEEDDEDDEDERDDVSLARIVSGVSARTVEDVSSKTATKERCRELCLGLAPVLAAEWSREIVATLDFVCKRPNVDERSTVQSASWYDDEDLSSQRPVTLTVDLSISSVPSLYWLLVATKDRMLRGGECGGLSDTEDDSTVGGGSSSSIVAGSSREATPKAFAAGKGTRTTSASSCASSRDGDDERRCVLAAELEELVAKLELLVDSRIRGRRLWSLLRKNLKTATILYRKDPWNRVSFAIQQEVQSAAHFLRMIRTPAGSRSWKARKTARICKPPTTSRHDLREKTLRELLTSRDVLLSSEWHQGLQRSAKRLETFLFSRGCAQTKCKLCDRCLLSSHHGPIVVAVQPRAQDEDKRMAGWLHGECARCEKCGLEALRLPAHWWSPPRAESTLDMVHLNTDGRVVCGKCAEEAGGLGGSGLVRRGRSSEGSAAASFDQAPPVVEESGGRMDVSSSSCYTSSSSPSSSSSSMSLLINEASRRTISKPPPSLYEEAIIRRRVEARLKCLRSFDWGASSESLTPATCLVNSS